MLTRQQLADFARREGVALHVVERDYVQHLILRHAAREPFAFKGGTCLRIAHGSPRYSEDLDFNAPGADAAYAHLQEAVLRLGDYGIRATVERRPSPGGLSARVRFAGPLFEGTDRSRGTIRMEISVRGERVKVEEVFVPRTPYADVPQLVLRCLNLEHLFAEKVRALLVRGQPRDLYDVHYLLGRGARSPRALLDAKMQLYGRTFSARALDRGIRKAGSAWKSHLEPLLGMLPPYDVVARDVRSGLRAMAGTSD